MATPDKANAIVIISGGMDSSVLAHYVIDSGYHPRLITFNYGQRHGLREIECAAWQAATLNVPHSVIDLTTIQPLLKGSALTDPSVDVPEGHYEQDNMKATVVPNRNAIMLSIAYGAAVGNGAEVVFAAMHAGDHEIYPDCRQEFIAALNSALILGNTWADPIPHLESPFVNFSKADIATIGHKLGVSFAHTWSCYVGGEMHCGACGTCTERIEAFRKANIEDPTAYDPEGLIKYNLMVNTGSVV